VFAHTTSRIDVELGARLFRHLLVHLPLAYFQARRVGDTVARVRELENIRSFLTGNAITLVLDLIFSVVFIAVMLWYSGWLTLVVVLSLPCYADLAGDHALAAGPAEREIQSRRGEPGLSGGDHQRHRHAEGHGRRAADGSERWDAQLAAYVSASFRTATLANGRSRGGVDLIGKLVTVITLWLGALLVIDGDLTVGQLIAFNMLAGRVASR
jgi:subfamily B ATP-binding cassette protein HlyB/CyaB